MYSDGSPRGDILYEWEVDAEHIPKMLLLLAEKMGCKFVEVMECDKSPNLTVVLEEINKE